MHSKQRVKSAVVRVPASTSNLGAGFDCFGLALQLYLTAKATIDANLPRSSVISAGEGKENAGLSLNDDNLIYRSMAYAAGREETSLPPVQLDIDNNIPISRGLGGSAAAIISLGEVYWRQKRYDEAEKTLLNGLKLDDKSWRGYFTLARLYLDLENIAKAGPAVGRTLQLKPDFAPGHLLAGNILLRINQRERALAAYQEYLRLEPKGEFAQQARELVQKLSKAIVENKK